MLSWPSRDDDEDEMSPAAGAEVVRADDDWDRYLLELGAARREGLRAGGRLASFIGLGLAVAATGWMNVTGHAATGAPAHPIDEALMWAFAVTGTLLVIASLILLVMAVIDALSSRRRRMAA